MLSTGKLFIIVVIAFILIFVFVIGFNPFSFIARQNTANDQAKDPLSPAAQTIIINNSLRSPAPEVTEMPAYSPVPIDR